MWGMLRMTCVDFLIGSSKSLLPRPTPSARELGSKSRHTHKLWLDSMIDDSYQIAVFAPTDQLVLFFLLQ